MENETIVDDKSSISNNVRKLIELDELTIRDLVKDNIREYVREEINKTINEAFSNYFDEQHIKAMTQRVITELVATKVIRAVVEEMDKGKIVDRVLIEFKNAFLEHWIPGYREMLKISE